MHVSVSITLGPAVTRLLTNSVLLLVLATPLDARAGSTGSLRSSSGGTGVSSHGGSGGTGLSSHGSASGSIRGLSGASSTHASTPASGTQQQLTPAKPHNTPPAGVRPHTDLAAATKIIGLSSGNLIKHSSLFPKMSLPAGDPSLAGPVMNKIGATEGGSASFKAVAGLSAAQSNGRVYPTNGGTSGGGRSGQSLSGSAAAVTSTDSDAIETPRQRSGGLLAWLHGLLIVAGIGSIGYWMWTATPKGARMTLPATTA